MAEGVYVNDAGCRFFYGDYRRHDIPGKDPGDGPAGDPSGPFTVKCYYCVDKREISFLRFVLEGCEGLAVMTTIDPRRGFVVFSIAPGCEMEFERVLEDLQPDILMEPVSPDADKPGQQF